MEKYTLRTYHDTIHLWHDDHKHEGQSGIAPSVGARWRDSQRITDLKNFRSDVWAQVDWDLSSGESKDTDRHHQCIDYHDHSYSNLSVSFRFDSSMPPHSLTTGEKARVTALVIVITISLVVYLLQCRKEYYKLNSRYAISSLSALLFGILGSRAVGAYLTDDVSFASWANSLIAVSAVRVKHLF